MTKYLNQALLQNTTVFSQNLKRLNHLHDNQSIDIIFTNQINQKINQKIKLLGFDFEDVTPDEVYFGLREKIKYDENQFIEKYQHDSLINGLIQYLNHLLEDTEPVITIKSSLIKQVIISLKPLKTRRLLGYRSYQSMIKREPLAEILLSIKYYETKNFINRFNSSTHNLSVSDFVKARLKVYLSRQTLEQFSSNQLLYNFETGQIMLVNYSENKLQQPGQLSQIIYRFWELVNNWIHVSYLLENFSFRPDFSNLYNSLKCSLNVNLNIDNQNWLKKTNQFDYFLNQEINDRKFNYLSGELLNINFGSNFEFWNDVNYLVAVLNNQAVSLNLADISIDLLQNHDYVNRSLRHGVDNLKKKLFFSYFNPNEVNDYYLQSIKIQDQSYLNQLLKLSR
jgi:hypothetical protein